MAKIQIKSETASEICTHAIQCFALKELADEKLNGLFFGIDEFRH